MFCLVESSCNISKNPHSPSFYLGWTLVTLQWMIKQGCRKTLCHTPILKGCLQIPMVYGAILLKSTLSQLHYERVLRNIIALSKSKLGVKMYAWEYCFHRLSIVFQVRMYSHFFLMYPVANVLTWSVHLTPWHYYAWPNPSLEANGYYGAIPIGLWVLTWHFRGGFGPTPS